MCFLICPFCCEFGLDERPRRLETLLYRALWGVATPPNSMNYAIGNALKIYAAEYNFDCNFCPSRSTSTSHQKPTCRPQQHRHHHHHHHHHHHNHKRPPIGLSQRWHLLRPPSSHPSLRRFSACLTWCPSSHTRQMFSRARMTTMTTTTWMTQPASVACMKPAAFQPSTSSSTRPMQHGAVPVSTRHVLSGRYVAETIGLDTLYQSDEQDKMLTFSIQFSPLDLPPVL